MFLRKHVGGASRQQVDGLSCLTVSSGVLWPMALNHVILATLLLYIHSGDPTFLFEMEILMVCQIRYIFSVKKEKLIAFMGGKEFRGCLCQVICYSIHCCK